MHLITVPLQPLGLIWHLTSMLHSLLSETFSSLGDCALALDGFLPTSLTFLFLLGCSNTVQHLLRFTPLVSPLGISPTPLTSIIRSCHMHNLPLSPPLLLKTVNVFALTKNEIRLFTKANKDPPDLIGAGFSLCLISYPPDLCSWLVFISLNTPTSGHLHLLFAPLEKIFPLFLSFRF